MKLPALRPPLDIWVEFNGIDGDGRTTVPVDFAVSGVTLAVGVQLVAGDLEGNRVPAIVISIDTRTSVVELKLHMDSFVPAPTKGQP